MLILVPAALGFELAETATASLDAPATRIVSRVRWEVAYAFVSGPTDLIVMDATTLAPVASLGRGAVDVIVRDSVGDGDSAPEIWLCDTDGVWVAAWPEPETIEAPVRVLTTACAGFASLDGALVVAGDTLTRRLDEAGSLGESTELGEAPANPLFAWDGNTVLAASAGGSVVSVVTLDAFSTIEAAGPIGGLALVGGVGRWSLPETDVVVAADGTTLPVAPEPTGLAVGDLDGDGADDLVVLHAAEGLVGVVRASVGAEELFDAPDAGGALAVVPAEGACDRLWSVGADGTTLHVATVTDCGHDLDTDRDGWTPDEGDCDDTDADVWPGAPEGCGYVDRDCDGVVVWDAGDWLSPTMAVLEGSTLAIDPGACFDGVTVEWSSVDDAALRCAGGSRLACTGRDDGESTVAADVWSPEGELLDHRESTITVVNVAPRHDPWDMGTFEDTAVLAQTEVTITDRIEVIEPGEADTVSFTLLDAPDGLVVDDGGTIEWTPTEDQVGTYRTTLILEDDDGGRTEVVYDIEVVDGSSDPCCGLGGAALLVVAVRPLRRRRGARTPAGHPAGGPPGATLQS